MTTAINTTTTMLALDVGNAWNTGVTAGWVILWTIVGLAGFALVVYVGFKTRNAGAVVGTLVLIALVVVAGVALTDIQGTATDTGNTISDIGGGGGDEPAPGQ